MWGIAVEDVGDGFALVGRQRGDIDQRAHARMLGGRDDPAGIGVSDHDDRPFGPVDGAVERVDVVGERGERDRGGYDRDAGLLQTGDDRAPAGSVGPCSVDEYHRGRRRL